MSGTVDALIPLSRPAELASLSARLPDLFLADPKSSERFWEFFAANIRNRNTRRAYYRAACTFSDWCEGRGLFSLKGVKAIDVATYIEKLQKTHSKPTVKQELAALRMLFDWLVVGHIIEVNPAHSVRGPKHRVKKGKTPVLIAVMAYTFARVGAATAMLVEDYFVQGRRSHLRLHEKGGIEHVVPAHHNLDEYTEAYIYKGCGHRGRPQGLPVPHGGRQDGTAHHPPLEPVRRLPDD